MTTYKIKRPITILRDDLIIEQLPKSVVKKLGPTQETGFHLGEMRRDIFCESGTIQYKLGADVALVDLL